MTEIKEKWFVYDDDYGFSIFDVEGDAYGDYLFRLNQYREESKDEGYVSEVESLAWGQIYRTTKLSMHPNKYQDSHGEMYQDAISVNHRIMS